MKSEDIVKMIDDEIDTQIKRLEDWDWAKDDNRHSGRFREASKEVEVTVKALSELKRLIMLSDVEATNADK